MRWWILAITGLLTAVAAAVYRSSDATPVGSIERRTGGVEVEHLVEAEISPAILAAEARADPDNKDPIVKPQEAPPSRVPRGPREAMALANPYSKPDLLKMRHTYLRIPEDQRVDFLLRVLEHDTPDNPAMRDKLLFLASREGKVFTTSFWKKILDRSVPRSAEERYQMARTKPAARLEAVDLAVMEQLQAIEGLTRAARTDAEAAELLWGLALGTREIPFGSDFQRLEAMRGLALIDQTAYLKLAKRLPNEDPLRDTLMTITAARRSR